MPTWHLAKHLCIYNHLCHKWHFCFWMAFIQRSHPIIYTDVYEYVHIFFCVMGEFFKVYFLSLCPFLKDFCFDNFSSSPKHTGIFNDLFTHFCCNDVLQHLHYDPSSFVCLALLCDSSVLSLIIFQHIDKFITFHWAEFWCVWCWKKWLSYHLAPEMMLWQLWQDDWTCEWSADCLEVTDWFMDSWRNG